jgi:hypothetical protein
LTVVAARVVDAPADPHFFALSPALLVGVAESARGAQGNRVDRNVPARVAGQRDAEVRSADHRRRCSPNGS